MFVCEVEDAVVVTGGGDGKGDIELVTLAVHRLSLRRLLQLSLTGTTVTEEKGKLGGLETAV
jgi:hypothetical protein